MCRSNFDSLKLSLSAFPSLLEMSKGFDPNDRQYKYQRWLVDTMKPAYVTDIISLPFRDGVCEAIWLFPPEIKECFSNALAIATELECNVVLGHYAHNKFRFPSMHAWCEKDGYHFDPTVEHALENSVYDYTYAESFRMSAEEYEDLYTSVPYTDMIFGIVFEREVTQ
jgi:hypothetical protein